MSAPSDAIADARRVAVMVRKEASAPLTSSLAAALVNLIDGMERRFAEAEQADAPREGGELLERVADLEADHSGHGTVWSQGVNLKLADLEERFEAFTDSVVDEEVRDHGARRERIATALLAGMYSDSHDNRGTAEAMRRAAIEEADALIAELDK